MAGQTDRQHFEGIQPEIVAEIVIPNGEMNPSDKFGVMQQPRFATALERSAHHLGLPFERVPIAMQDAITLRRGRQIVGNLMVNPVWRDRFQEAGVKVPPRNAEEWQTLPITDREALHDLYGGKREGLIMPLEYGGFQITASGGTTSGPIETVYSRQELTDSYQTAGKFLGKYVLGPHFEGEPHWIFTQLNDSGMWSSGTLIGGILREVPRANFLPAGPIEQQTLQHLLGYPGDKAMLGLPRELYDLAEKAREMPDELRESLKVAMYGGGVMLDHKLKQFTDVFPKAKLLSFFSSTQALAMGVQTDPEGTMRVVPGMHIMEVVDEDGKWVKPGEEGELLVTRLHAQEAPVIRMRIGDRIKMHDPTEDDELQARHFEYGGRSGDIIHIGESHYDGRKLYHAAYPALEEMGINVRQHVGDVQFLVNQHSGDLQMLFGVSNGSTIPEHILDRLTPTVQRNVIIHGLKAAIPMFDQDASHMKTLDELPWNVGIQFINDADIYRTPRNKVPLVRTVKNESHA